jgi:hypothetical protein
MKSLGMAVMLVSVAAACGERPALVRVLEARQRTADVRAQLAKADSATNRAVMADTDAASAAFVAEAAQATTVLQADIDALGPLLEGLQFGAERNQLAEFERAFAAYRDVDAQILTLAVDNTNVKAQRLSFGPALVAVDAFEEALGRLAPAPGGEWKVEALKARALAEVREIQTLHAPHIAEADDQVMDRLEARMHDAESRAKMALTDLRPLTASRAALDDAVRQLAQFLDLTSQVLSLSRRNTDLRSLALTLNEKGKLHAECERALQTLDEALEHRMSAGRRSRDSLWSRLVPRLEATRSVQLADSSPLKSCVTPQCIG